MVSKEEKEQNKRHHPIRFILMLFLCLILVGILFTGGQVLAKGFIEGELTLGSFSFSSLASLPVFSMFFDINQEKEDFDSDVQQSVGDDGIINILLMGIDARVTEENSRSDTMILLSVDEKNKQVALISIPRDTKITTEKGVVEKINAVNAIEGPEAACKVVGDLLQVNVDYYVVVNFNSFITIVDILGGVDLYVDMDMFHADDQTPELEIELFEGQQHLNGEQALQYVRYRGGQTADIGRTQRQQKFLKALADKMFSIGIIPKIPSLWSEVKSSVRTDLTLSNIISLVKVAVTLQDVEIYSQTVPGKSGMSEGVSYWIVDESVLPTLVSDVCSGKLIDVSGDPQGVGTTRSISSDTTDCYEEEILEQIFTDEEMFVFDEEEIFDEIDDLTEELSEPVVIDEKIIDKENILLEDFWMEEDDEDFIFFDDTQSPLGDLTEPLAPVLEGI